MSTMPAEGSQSPSQEELHAHLADTSTTTSPTTVTKAKTPENQHAAVSINASSSSSQTHNNSHLRNDGSASQSTNSTSKSRSSPTQLTQSAMSSSGAAGQNEHCQGTAHFYRQTVERLPPPFSSGLDGIDPMGVAQVNGSVSSSALDPEPSQSSSGRCHCGADRWVADGRERGTDGPSYRQEDWRVTNGHRRSEALHNGLGPGDDMENYFNANAHMLAYLDLQEDEEEEPSGGAVGGEGRCPRHPDTRRQSSSDSGSHDMRPMSGYSNGYRYEDSMIVNGSDGPESRSATLVASRRMSTSSEDLGVCITDIGLPPLEIEDSCDMRASSSEDDLPQLTSASTRRQFCRGTNRGSDNTSDSWGHYNSGSAQRPREGPKLLPPEAQPNSSVGLGHQPICDYKNGSSSEASRPASFGVLNRLCTCSVVSYSRRRPLAPSNQSSSDLDVDEGVGGMKASPMEPSPVESEGRPQCGVTVTSDSSSYFSPEDVDFMDFDMAMPSDNVGDFAEMGANISHAEDNDQATTTMTENNTDSKEPTHHHYHHSEWGGETRGSSDSGTPCWVNGDPCEDCGKPEQNCLCASLRTCKRLLEGANNAHQQQVSLGEGQQGLMAESSSHCKRLCSGSNRADNLQVANCGCCNDSVAGRDSGSGSQEHLDTLSYDEDRDEDDAFENPVPPPHRTCSCSYQVCGRREDTNNLDVEVFSAAPSSDYEDELFNVSRQTSTSNFDQDENAYQDAVEDCASNGFHSACSGSDLESEKSNHNTNHNHMDDEEPMQSPPVYVREPPSPRPPEIPLPIPARSMDHAPRQPPSLPPFSPGDHPGLVLNGCPDCGGAERPPWLLDDNQLPSPPCVIPHWREYDLPSDRHDSVQRRQRTCAAWMAPDEDDSPPAGVGYLEQDFTRQDSMARHNGPSGNLPLCDERPPAGSSAFVTDAEERTEEDEEAAFPDPLPDIFILNLLREKESRALYAASGTRPAVEKVMIWNEYEAYVLQVKQIGASACGATAIINVLKAFNIYVDKVVVSEAIKTNTRAEKAPVAEYLLSRSVAGCTAQHLMEGVEEVTGGEIVGRFFSFYPERDVDILHWLGEWMKKGAVAILTLNLQRAVPQGWDVPDAWHHQMAYGVGPKGVYLTNPLEIVPEDVIREQLTSDSELLVQRQDVISRWTADTDLRGLLTHPDARWRQFNVIGQVVNVLREARRPRVLGFRPQLTPHIRIPAWYRPGISLFVRRNSDIHEELFAAPSLPLRPPPPPEPPRTSTSVNISPGPSLPAASMSTAKQKEEELPEPEPEFQQQEEEEGDRGSPLLLQEEPSDETEEGGATGGSNDAR